VLYGEINAERRGVMATENAACASTCKELRTCAKLAPAERELGCISPYCAPFRFEVSTENWAEQYRFYYQSSETRALLTAAASACVAVLAAIGEPQFAAPWERNLPDPRPFRPSLWDSCGGRACKPW
jgi:hypothetical protein